MASDNRSNQPPPTTSWLLRRADQAIVATLVLLGLASTVGWWIAHGGLRGEMLEIERAEPRVASFEVDPNTAEWAELAQLPGIGPTLAKRIVESRETDGPFFDNEEIQRVRGIGPKTLENIRPYLRPVPNARAMAGP